MSSQYPSNRSVILKRTYVAPRLICYGIVRQLTMASTGASTETGQPANCSMNAAMNCASDRSTKENIVPVGRHYLGIGLYLFDFKKEFQYRLSRERQFGVMADEVETVMPEAVSVHPDGYKMVDYSMLGITRFVH